MSDQLRVAWVIDRLDPCDDFHQLRIVMVNVLHEIVLGVGRARDENRTRVRDRFGNRVQEVLVGRGMATADRTRLVMHLLGRVIRMQDELLDICRIEMEYPCLAVIDPNDGVIMMRAHGKGPF